jgi:hypothetical protein
MKKPIALVAALAAVAIAMFIAWRWFGATPPSAAPSQAELPSPRSVDRSPARAVVEPIVPKPTDTSIQAEPERDVPAVAVPTYELKPVAVSYDPTSDAAKPPTAPFQLRGGAGAGKIVDATGKVILESGSKSGINIFGCEVSQDNKRILVQGGDAKALVLDPATGSRQNLPTAPPGKDMLGFGSWRWLDPDTLIGVSGKTLPFREDQVGALSEEPMIERSVLYLYDLKTQQLSEVELPPRLRTKTLSVSAIDPTGKVQLRPEGGPASFTDESYGWFDVRPRK